MIITLGKAIALRTAANPLARSVKIADLKDNLTTVPETASGSEREAKMWKYRQALKLIGA
ncbi:hypothetical protein [Parvibaculum sp.]|jgi:hypothetical protein|uniref:hypothetical protein n=1 Tax=Parvibaculum sp. TaxID=2024848 RepID=UPI003299F142